jgi:hypothetical protein
MHGIYTVQTLHMNAKQMSEIINVPKSLSIMSPPLQLQGAFLKRYLSMPLVIIK